MHAGALRLQSATGHASYPTAHFKITVTNRGSGRLHDLRVTDRLAPSCNRTIATIAAGYSFTFGCKKVRITAGFTNVATVSTNATGTSIAASTRARVNVKAGSAGARAKNNSGVNITKSTSGKTVTLNIPDVLFAFNQSTPGPSSTPILTAVLKLLTGTFPIGHMVVTGYTDNVGPVAYNLDLSRRRATTIARWLEQHGIPGTRISIAWDGKANPVASNATAQGRQKNRRVTVTVRTSH